MKQAQVLQRNAVIAAGRQLGFDLLEIPSLHHYLLSLSHLLF